MASDAMWAWASAHPFLFTILAAWLLTTASEIFFRLPNRWIRSRNIAARGWPPEHLDADGDWRDDD